jgi:hypothetical protein
MIWRQEKFRARAEKGPHRCDPHGKLACVAVLRRGLGCPWERIHYAEFDGRRRKRVLVKIIGK